MSSCRRRRLDEFFGNLYHLNAEEEPENPDYPKSPEFKKKFGPRGVLHTWANPDGTQKIENTGPLTIKRMETVDEEFLDAGLKFMEKAVKDEKPFFVWWNSTRMHIFTHLKKESEGKTGLGIYPDGMVEHDGHVGQLLDKLVQLGIADNTIVMYSTDNGAEVMSWPDGGTTPFRGEKDTNYEGGWRVPAIRCAGVVETGARCQLRSSRAPTCWRRGCHRRRADAVEAEEGQSRAARPSRSHRQLRLLPFPRGEARGTTQSSSTGATTAICLRYARQMEGDVRQAACAWSSCVFEPPVSCAARSSTTCAATRSAGHRGRLGVL
jgi:arylsulfatase